MTYIYTKHLIILKLVMFTAFASLDDTKQGIKDGKIPIRGVNLGGWLVAENWMTKDSPAWNDVPEDVANKGEYTTMKYLGHEQGDRQFDEHRRNFITERDFNDIAAAGLNTVRIPIGYWIVGFDESGGGDSEGWKTYAPGALNYLDKAIREWGPRNNILVIISVHAAKGSQNGNDHSSPTNPGQTYWFGYRENIVNTLDAVKFLAQRYKDDTSFLGIGLLNEPNKDASDEDVLKQYYRDAYQRIRNEVNSDCLLITSPMLWQQNPEASDWKTFMSYPEFFNIRHEWHHYHVWGFESDKGWNAERLIDWIKDTRANEYDRWTGNWLFVGEWSIATSGGIDMDDNTLRRYAQAQLNAFNKAKGGWTYWTWKFYNNNENAWNMKSMLKKGVLSI